MIFFLPPSICNCVFVYAYVQLYAHIWVYVCWNILYKKQNRLNFIFAAFFEFPMTTTAPASQFFRCFSSHLEFFICRLDSHHSTSIFSVASDWRLCAFVHFRETEKIEFVCVCVVAHSFGRWIGPMCEKIVNAKRNSSERLFLIISYE